MSLASPGLQESGVSGSAMSSTSLVRQRLRRRRSSTRSPVVNREWLQPEPEGATTAPTRPTPRVIPTAMPQHTSNTALEHWGKLLVSIAPDRDFSGAGSGAAGGFPSGFLALTSAQLDTDFDLVSGLVGLEEHLNDADVLVVGEGSLDQQSLQGKAPLSAAVMATAMNIPVVAIAGQLSLSGDELAAAGIQAAASLSDSAPSTEAAMRAAPQYAEQATVKALRQLDHEYLGSQPTHPLS